jgi:hypothetical protein
MLLLYYISILFSRKELTELCEGALETPGLKSGPGWSPEKENLG